MYSESHRRSSPWTQDTDQLTPLTEIAVTSDDFSFFNATKWRRPIPGQFFFGSKFGSLACKGAYATVLDLIMDPFDGVLPVTSAARTRPGKAKSKQLLRKEIQASKHATSSKYGISGNECRYGVASTLSMPAEKSKGFIHHTGVAVPNSEMGNPKQVTVKGDSAALVDDYTITAFEVDADQNSTNFLKPVQI